MTKITFAGVDYSCNPGETVLEALLRQGAEPPSSCRSGSCQTCMMRAVAGTPPADAQKGLKPTLQHRGFFLACICKPEMDMTVAVAGEEALPRIATTVVEKSMLNSQIARLRLRPESAIDFQSGQFINLHRPDGLIRSYSIASLHNEGVIELHVERVANGRMSGWLHDDVRAGDNIEIDGPHGDCFYLSEKPQQNLLLIGTGSGLAPLWGIARSALEHGHQGEIHLFHGSRSPEKLYLVDELRALASQHGNFFYTPCVSGENSAGFTAGRANEVALQRFPKLGGWGVYLCGHPEMVNNTKRDTFLAGANFQDIYADPFTISS